MLEQYLHGRMAVQITLKGVPLTPRGIIEHLKLRKPIYQATAAYGHFGREPKDGQFSWETVDKVSELSRFAPASSRTTGS